MMFRSNTRSGGALLALCWCGLIASCGDFSSDTERFSKLDRLRVLAIQATPADLAPGETTTLSALVYEPKNREIKYEWSWCPLRGDESNGFTCLIAEKDLQKAWQQTGEQAELPPYDLGEEAEVTFTHVFTPELMSALCGSLAAAASEPEQAALACLRGLQVSVGLTVSTSKEQIVSIKDLVLLNDSPETEQRNVNPELGADLKLRDMADDSKVDSDDALQAGHKYVVESDLNEAIAQSYVPGATAAEPEPEARRENLTLTWFMTEGMPVSLDPSGLDFTGDNERTTFVDGYNEFAALGKKGWELPLTAGPEDAELVLVLRDERGGVGWAKHKFQVKESQ